MTGMAVPRWKLVEAEALTGRQLRRFYTRQYEQQITFREARIFSQLNGQERRGCGGGVTAG